MLVTPTIRTCLPTLAETDIDHGPPGTEETFLAVSANTRPFNYLGLPAVSVPCGFDPNGCPIGLQIAGRPFAEARVLQVADAYQRDTDWHTRRPPVLDARRRHWASSWHEQAEGRVHRHGRHDRLARRGPLDLQDYGATRQGDARRRDPGALAGDRAGRRRDPGAGTATSPAPRSISPTGRRW